MANRPRRGQQGPGEGWSGGRINKSASARGATHTAATAPPAKQRGKHGQCALAPRSTSGSGPAVSVLLARAAPSLMVKWRVSIYSRDSVADGAKLQHVGRWVWGPHEGPLPAGTQGGAPLGSWIRGERWRP